MVKSYGYSLAKYQSIQVIRGIACLLVMAFHASLQLKEYYGIDVSGCLFSQGYAGVDLFFVISGFVIAHSSYKLIGNVNMLGVYFIKRFIRIYPLYWLVLIPSVIGLLLTAPDKLPIGNPITIFGHWLTIVLLIPNHEAVNAVSWSLSHELYFYLLFSLLIISPQLWTVLALIIAVTVLGMTGLYSPASLAFYVSPFNLEFCAGVFIWHISKRVKPSVVLSIVSIVAGVFIISLFHEHVSNESYTDRVLVFGSASSFLLFGFLKLDEYGKCNGLKLVSSIGDASYILYLFHLPFMIIVNKVIKANTEDPATIIALNIALFFSATFLSIYGHNHLEKPLIARLLKRVSLWQSQPRISNPIKPVQ